MIFPAEEPAQNRRGESWHLPAARGARCGRVERRRGQRQRWSWAVGGPLPWPSRSPLTAPGSPPPAEGQGAVSSREEDSFGRGFGAGLSPGHPPVSLQGWVVFGPEGPWQDLDLSRVHPGPLRPAPGAEPGDRRFAPKSSEY